MEFAPAVELNCGVVHVPTFTLVKCFHVCDGRCCVGGSVDCIQFVPHIRTLTFARATNTVLDHSSSFRCFGDASSFRHLWCNYRSLNHCGYNRCIQFSFHCFQLCARFGCSRLRTQQFTFSYSFRFFDEEVETHFVFADQGVSCITCWLAQFRQCAACVGLHGVTLDQAFVNCFHCIFLLGGLECLA
ncbi:hypothetical protein Vid5_gp80 [Pantoea phage vB_PagS_Vid5]|uniref:Uncharacterized protein n=1 Tax=Pantoea phage vB_PagS_Vid5 TaxID=2099652 RepID=A0A2P1CLB7_9CAUD|nr:hypothetical protein FDJ45_gp075 [Pantoea phage vB_PagS_Vid5]AVJ51835.1 hypothetical protein Vid5_gp80 [Pantoea phage vB_PagS_Vid5]